MLNKVSTEFILTGMMDNHLYNLMMQVVAESKSLQRIKSAYDSDSGECTECKDFWQKLSADKEDHINELKELIKKQAECNIGLVGHVDHGMN